MSEFKCARCATVFPQDARRFCESCLDYAFAFPPNDSLRADLKRAMEAVWVAVDWFDVQCPKHMIPAGVPMLRALLSELKEKYPE